MSVARSQQIFNESRFIERAAAGELTEHVASSHLAPPKAGMPPGTLSQIIAYRDQKGDELASAHRYLKPDGTLGASGMPDPKSVMVNGVLHTAWWGTRIGNL